MGCCSGLRKPTVVLDTNILMLLHGGVDVLGTLEDVLEARPRYLVPSLVVEELERISEKGSPKERRAARFALSLIQRLGLEVVEVERLPGEGVDDAIARFARDNGYIVATSDRELRRKLRRMGVLDAYYRESERRVELGGDTPVF